MDLREYLALLRKRWLLIVALTTAGVAVAAVYTVLSEPLYRSRVQLFVSTQGASSNSDLLQGQNFTQQRTNTYARIVTSENVLQPVIDELGLPESVRELAAHVSAEAPVDTVLLNVYVTDPSNTRAAMIADSVAASFVSFISTLEQPQSGAAALVKVSAVEPAEVPRSPFTPRTKLNLAAGLLAGLLLGVGIAAIREILETRVHGEAELRRVTDSAILGGIAFDKDAPHRPLIVQAGSMSTRAEAFRQLRTNLQFVDLAKRPRSMVITSSIPGEGKSTTSTNLALTMAADGKRICLIEGDLRRPRAASYLGLEGAVGLTDVLIGRATLADALQPWGEDEQLFVLPAGPTPPNPSELLGSNAMKSLLAELALHFDLVLIDAPPLLPVTDAAVLGAITDGTVLIVGSGKVKRDQVAKALSNLEAVESRLFGVVLNLLPPKGPGSYGYYSYGYYDPPSPAHAARRKSSVSAA